MNKSTSLYLDLVRAVAAVVVLLAHAGLPFFSQGQTWLRPYGHAMLVIFFVLSGFVIAGTTAKNGGSWRSFGADRLSRLYSVVLPALILTAVLDHVGWMFDPSPYGTEVRWDHYGARILLGAAFLADSWQTAIKVGSNSPLWSVTYEFWYYFLFGGLVFARRWWKLVPVLLFVVATGYNISLLLPVWLLGVAAYSLCRKQWISAPVGTALALASLVWIIMVITRVASLPGDRIGWIAEPPLYWSSNFVGDFVLGLLVFGNFVGVDAMLRGRSGLPPNSRWAATIRYAAGRSFSVYAFHLPILVFCAATVPFDHKSSWQVAGVLLFVISCILILSELTEQQRHSWRRLFRILFGLPADRGAEDFQGWTRGAGELR